MTESPEPMWRLASYLRKYTGNLIFAISSSTSYKVLDMMPPLMVGWLVDTVAGSPQPWSVKLANSDGIWENVLVVCLLVGIVFFFESLTEWLLKSSYLRLAQKVQHDLRLDAYHQLQNREIAYFEQNRTGNLMTMLNDDINQLERFLNDSFNQIIQLVVLFIFAFFALFSISWELALIALAPMPFIIWGSFHFQKIISPRYQKVRNAVGELSSRLENNISGILVVKSFAAESYEYERVKEASEAYQKANFEAIKYNALYMPLIRMLIAAGMVAGLVLGAYQVLDENSGVTVGQLTLFAMLLQRILWPITLLGMIFNEYERAKASARRVFGLMDAPNEVTDPVEPAELGKVRGEIALENISFSYNSHSEVLKNIDLRLAPGETVGIAGTTGSGKTTLVKLLLRLYDVSQGVIKLDGVDIRQISLKDLRKNIALVSQDVYLFHGTIRENIAYGMDGCSKKDIELASRKAQLDEFVESLPEGYDTIVGERGMKLSGGQRQRISIARAILKNASILILDEATSAVDTETERAIQENLNQLAQGRTALIIAHRLSTIRHADSILVIKDGQVSERGTHNELLSHNGLYHDLWNVQTGEIEEGLKK
ncbi:ABC transporter ATP-binding protein [Flammeovirgaceae bacterium SG7u.111]|nr:ABC transporter ATP-binding protein [Flammeovirgaceae bacterium SG7u.132]WPO36776.1 ABC transporter ATP-binding protein [Flammeovirgaceae bacterium SG7u.111]